jgi:pimeloyl-ACP methyl ester carboxylesterase
MIPASRAYTANRLTLHCSDWGNEGAPPLILLHGTMDHGRSWDRVARELRHDYHVIAPDLRGHGDSDWSSDGHYSMAALVSDLAQLVRAWGLAPVTLVGHSLGGNICVRLAGLYPDAVTKLVSIEGLGLSPTLTEKRNALDLFDRIRSWIEDTQATSLRTPRRYADIDEAAARMASQFPHLDPSDLRHLTTHGIRTNEDGSFSWKFDNMVRTTFPQDLPTHELHRLWAGIHCPTLLIYGSESFASNPERDGRLAHFQNAALALVEKAGHWVHHDRPQEFSSILQGFLRGSHSH